MKHELLGILTRVFSIVCLLMLLSPVSVQAETGRVLIVVNSTLHGEITPSINQYVADLEFEGYTAVVEDMDGTETPQDLRGLLQSYYYDPAPGGIVGCVLIGNLPIPKYDAFEEVPVPFDLYYMDLDGTWIDNNQNGGFDEHQAVFPDDKKPEIWLGRIDCSHPRDGSEADKFYTFLFFEDEAACVTNYFVKNHHYRTGQLTSNYGALAFTHAGVKYNPFKPQWEHLCTSSFGSDSYLGYPGPPEDLEMYLTKICPTFNPEDESVLVDTTTFDYFNALTAGYEHVSLFGHGNGPSQHEPLTWPGVTSWNIRDDLEDVNVLFYTMDPCKCARYDDNRNIGNTYLLSANSRGLTFLGSTTDHRSYWQKVNEYWDIEISLWVPFSQGACWGEALQNYWEEGEFIYTAPKECYLEVFLGDPTLRRSDYMQAAWENHNVPEWIQRYDGPSNGSDSAMDILVRPGGNTFVTGSSYDSVGGYDMLTQKRDKNGDLLWEARWNSSQNRDDYAKALTKSSGGPIFVVGGMLSATKGLSWRVLKYSSSDGTLIWKANYNGPANKDDMAEDVAPDSNNNLFVAGWSKNADDTTDLVLQKYASTSSTAEWTKRFSIPASISAFVPRPVHVEVDCAGNAYLAGTVKYSQEDPNTDYVVAKYNSSYGTRLWYVTYDGNDSPNDEDELRDLAVDCAGNAYVTGGSVEDDPAYPHTMCTIKYDTNGNEVWRKLYAYGTNGTIGGAVGVDGSGNVFASGGSMAGCHTVKYDAAGNEQWSRTYGSQWAEPRSMAVDEDGNVVVAGRLGSSSSDYFVVRYDGDGNLQWSATYNGDADGDDAANAIGVDNDNNAYVTGYSYGTLNDFATLKYQP